MGSKQSNVILVNRRAVSFLAEGNYERALLTFIESIRTATETIDSYAPEMVESPSFPLSSYNSSFEQHEPTNVRSLDTIRVPLRESSDVCNGFFDVFHEAFVIRNTSAIDCHVLTAAIMFNVGLCYHIRALVGYRTCQSHGLMLKAHQSYEEALGQIKEVNAEVDADALVLILALLNNIGCLQASFCNPSEVRKCYALVEDLLETAMEVPDMLDDDTYDFYIFFTIMRSNQCFTSSPAA